MSVFNIERIKFDEKSDIEKVTKYLHKLNENLEYMFNNITPEDNYSSNALIRHIQEGDKVAEIAISVDNITQRVVTADNRISEIVTAVDGIKLNMVDKGNIISTINVSTEGVAIRGDKIKLEGTVTANNRFVINTDGSMSCQNANISGKINSAEIYGDLSVQCGQFYIRNPNQDDIRDFEMGLGHFQIRYSAGKDGNVFESTRSGLHDRPLKIYDDGDMVCKDIRFDNEEYDSWLKGWSLLAMLKDLYDKYEA